VGRRRLLLIGAIGMSACEFIVAIVGVTAGHIDPVTQAVNLVAQKVLIAFVCLFVSFFFFFFSNFVICTHLSVSVFTFFS
jgi:MFS transporter, SP family, sugar:H+ symporter